MDEETIRSLVAAYPEVGSAPPPPHRPSRSRTHQVDAQVVRLLAENHGKPSDALLAELTQLAGGAAAPPPLQAGRRGGDRCD